MVTALPERLPKAFPEFYARDEEHFDVNLELQDPEMPARQGGTADVNFLAGHKRYTCSHLVELDKA